jgi:hypothetical protein
VLAPRRGGEADASIHKSQAQESIGLVARFTAGGGQRTHLGEQSLEVEPQPEGSGRARERAATGIASPRAAPRGQGRSRHRATGFARKRSHRGLLVNGRKAKGRREARRLRVRERL